MPRALVDRERVVKLRLEGRSVAAIARMFGVQPPAIYRALSKEGMPVSNRPRPEPRHKPQLYPPERSYRRAKGNDADELAWIAANRIAPREPCARCGVRGDIGCGCVKAPVGWRAG